MKLRYVVIGVLLILGLSALLYACGESNAGTEQQETSATREAEPMTVRIQEVQPTRFADIITTSGTIAAYEDVLISPEEGGIVKEWLVRKGERVQKGDILCVLNDDVIRASYDAALAQYKLAELNYEMQKGVYQEKAISELQYKNSEFNRDAAKAQADLMRARFERTRIRTPISGVLNNRMQDAGEFAPPMTPIAHVVNLGAIKVETEVSERYGGSLQLGDEAMIIADAFPSDTLHGKVIFIGASISPNNRTLPVEVAIGNPGLKLKPEMIVRVRIVRAVRPNALLVSQNAIQQVDRDKMVVFVEVDGKAEERVVTLGSQQGQKTEILSGLNSGDRVIITGIQKLTSGQPVTVSDR